MNKIIEICTVFRMGEYGYRFKYHKNARLLSISKRKWGPYTFYSRKMYPSVISYTHRSQKERK